MITQEEFRNAMARLGAAVNIITSDGEAGRCGLTVSAMCSVTDTPPTVIVCINKNANSHPIFAGNKVLCVNILAGRHERHAMEFASTSKSSDERFGTGEEWTTLVTGSPVLKDAAVALDCRIVDVAEVGSHSVLYCEIDAVKLASEPESLIYFDRCFHHLTCEPADTSADIPRRG
ncbi:MAG: hypothetical protein CME88_05015 [Hirschia sp.]|nr:hypothetical protein [Hirschia sp.]MBF17723.1 hypothetical protein [Hirschia sp.]